MYNSVWSLHLSGCHFSPLSGFLLSPSAQCFHTSRQGKGSCCLLFCEHLHTHSPPTVLPSEGENCYATGKLMECDFYFQL